LPRDRHRPPRRTGPGAYRGRAGGTLPGAARRGSGGTARRTRPHAALASSRSGGRLPPAGGGPGPPSERPWAHAGPGVLQLGRAGRLRRPGAPARRLVLLAARTRGPAHPWTRAGTDEPPWA